MKSTCARFAGPSSLRCGFVAGRSAHAVVAGEVEHRDGGPRRQRGDGGGQRRVRQEDGGGAVLDHVAEPVHRVAGIERHVGAAGLEDAQQPHHHLHAALHADPHPHVGTRRRARGGGAPAGWPARSAPRTSPARLRTPPPPRPACARPGLRRARGRTPRAGTRASVVFHSRSTRARSPSGSIGRRSTPSASSAANASSTRRR